jgi:tetratricopeptide (TPR) repeat protein
MQHNDIRSLAVSLQNLGDIQRELNSVECVVNYLEAFDVGMLILDQTVTASCAFNLGHTYKHLLHDLAAADRWYRISLEFGSQQDRRMRGGSLLQLGQIAHERFREAQEAGRLKDELLHHLNTALQFYGQALALVPSDAADMVATIQFAIGRTYAAGGTVDRALTHYREAIRHEEAAGELYGAATTRFNIAHTLANAGRFADAQEYARAALHNFETFGPRAAADVEKSQSLIAQIEQSLQSHES